MKIKHLLENEKFDYGIETFISSFEPFSMVTGTTMADGFYSYKPRKKPRDTFRPIHNTISLQSVERFGINIRSLLFCTFEKEMAKEYADNAPNYEGKVKHVYPIGDNYRLFSNIRADDMTQSLKIGEKNIYGIIMNILKDMYIGPIIHGYNKEIKTWMVDYRNFEGTFDDFIEDFINKISKFTDDINDQLKERDVTFDKDLFNKEFLNTMERIKNRCNKYITNVKEFKSRSDEGFTLYGEIMVYAPDGFVVSSNKI